MLAAALAARADAAETALANARADCAAQVDRASALAGQLASVRAELDTQSSIAVAVKKEVAALRMEGAPRSASEAPHHQAAVPSTEEFALAEENVLLLEQVDQNTATIEHLVAELAAKTGGGAPAAAVDTVGTSAGREVERLSRELALATAERSFFQQRNAELSAALQSDGAGAGAVLDGGDDASLQAQLSDALNIARETDHDLQECELSLAQVQATLEATSQAHAEELGKLRRVQQYFEMQIREWHLAGQDLEAAMQAERRLMVSATAKAKGSMKKKKREPGQGQGQGQGQMTKRVVATATARARAGGNMRGGRGGVQSSKSASTVAASKAKTALKLAGL